MFRNYRPVWEGVNLDNLAHNMKNIRQKVNCKEIFAVVEANGYGHGAFEVSTILLQNGATTIKSLENPTIKDFITSAGKPLLTSIFNSPLLISSLIKFFFLAKRPIPIIK